MVDYIIPFVDDSDSEWLRIYEQYSDDILDSGRWRDWGILKYQLRSIEKYMPWVDRIIIVLSIGATQIPEWLDTSNPKVRVVYDFDFVPKELLPTFNSNTIELYFPRIEGLSEHYLTACDDYILMRPFKESEFFSNDGKIRLNINKVLLKKNTYGKTVENSVRLVYPDGIEYTVDSVRCLWANHTVTPHIRSVNEAFLNEHEDKIYKSITRERESKNLTWLVYSLNAMRLGLLEKGDITVGVKRLQRNEDINNLTFNDCDVSVLNDWYEGWEFEDVKRILDKKLQNLLPNRCKFENNVEC